MDTISNFLIERGSPGVVLKRNEIRAYFAASAKSAALKRDIQRFLKGIEGIYPGVGEKPLSWKVLKDKSWNHAWRRFFSPRKIGRHFCVTPPWASPPPSRRRQVITIEPGMAFGTGTHVTTRCCLEFLEEAFDHCSQRPLRALDVGTGSGILAIAAAKLGAEKVLALDIDPVALKAARMNTRWNGVGRAVRLSNARLGTIKGTFHIVLANLTAETILSLARLLPARVAPEGFLILSGILSPKSEEVLRCFTPRPFALLRRAVRGEWTTLLLKKRR